MKWWMRFRNELWPLAPEQLKALGQVVLSLGVAAFITAASLAFMPTPGLSWYAVINRLIALCGAVIVTIPAGLILHRERGGSNEPVR